MKATLLFSPCCTRTFLKNRGNNLMLLFILMVVTFVTVCQTHAKDAIPAAKIVHTKGQVIVHMATDDTWHKASAGVPLKQGDSVQTGEDGWTALILADETMVQLNRNSLFTIKSVVPTAGWIQKAQQLPSAAQKASSAYELTSGQLWMRNKNKGIRIDVKTPLVTAGIRGTELDIRIGANQDTFLSVFEGSVLAKNLAEETVVNSMEQVIARTGQPLEKRLLLSTERTVQWVLHLPRDLDIETPELQEAYQKNPAARHQYANIQRAYNKLHGNDPTGAEILLSDITATTPEISAAWTLYAQSLLVNGKYEEALTAASKATALSPQSLPALLTKSYVHQALFNLDEAVASAKSAVKIAPESDAAKLALARLLFSMDNTRTAKKLLSGMAHKRSAPIQNLEGFIAFSCQETQTAIDCFSTAIALDPGMEESYLGLALAYMRQGNDKAATEAITTAISLAPRRSLFLSYWGKMLYEMGRTEKALDMLAQASQLDAADPTPWLYRAHILSDLNRAGEAIDALNTAVSLNDNRAVYRSRFLLDKDLAVKNVSLARLFWKLGIGDWGTLKAWKSVKLDYTNSAAHDFWAWALHYTSGDRGFGDTSEWLKAFLLKPANANTFNTFNDYTLFFEQPNIGGELAVIAGTDDWREGSLIAHGAFPQQNLSYQLDLLKYDRDQWRGGLYEKGYMVRPSIKWDITSQDHLSFKAHMESVDFGDTTSITDYNEPVDPANHYENDYGQVELGYYRKMSPRSDLIVHARHRFTNDIDLQSHYRFFYEPDYYDSFSNIGLNEPYTTFQLLHLYRIAHHQIMVGTFQYWGDREYNRVDVTSLDLGGVPIPLLSSETRSDKTRRQESYYLQDIWQLSPTLTLEAALYFDRMKNANSAENITWSEDYWNPRIGLMFSPTATDTFSIAYSRHLDPIQATAHIDPVDVVGMPLASLFEGAQMEEWGFGWQHEWQRGCLITRYFELNLDYDYRTGQSGMIMAGSVENHYNGIEASFNQILYQRFGLNLGYILVDVEDDESDPLNEGDNHLVYGRLSYLHPSGFYAGIIQQCFLTRYDNRPIDDENDFNNTSVYVGYEFANKRGDIKLNIVNLFDGHFEGVYLSDIAAIWPETTAWLQLKFYF